MDSVDYISIVISGNEDILTELRKIKYETLKQRIIVKYEIQGLNRAETKDYINTRLKLSGQLNEIFQENAINAIYGITNGNIRKINTMVQKSLMIGYQKGLKKIDEEIVRLAKEEIDI